MTDCEKYQLLIIDAIDSALDEDETCMLDKHLEQCSVCRDLFDDMKLLVKEERSLDDPIPEDLHEYLISAVNWRRKLDRMRKRTRRSGFAAAAVAVLILAGAGLAGIIPSADHASFENMTSASVTAEAYGLSKSLMMDAKIENADVMEKDAYDAALEEAPETQEDDSVVNEHKYQMSVKDSAEAGSDTGKPGFADSCTESSLSYSRRMRLRSPNLRSIS